MLTADQLLDALSSIKNNQKYPAYVIHEGEVRVAEISAFPLSKTSQEITARITLPGESFTRLKPLRHLFSDELDAKNFLLRDENEKLLARVDDLQESVCRNRTEVARVRRENQSLLFFVRLCAFVFASVGAISMLCVAANFLL